MQDVVVLEWTFSPRDFFEQPIHIAHENYEMIVDNGKIQARIDPDIYDKRPDMRDELHEALNARFLAVQLLSHTPYELSKASMYRLHADGRKDVTVFVESCLMTAFVGTLDIVVKDRDGNVISDSRKERLERKKRLADLVGTYRSKDPLLASLLTSYDRAVRDPQNELVHLYEIRDALSKRFGGETEALTALRISATQWSRLGQLANDEPLSQGRHRGKSVGVLRDATEGELKEARSIALELVEGYLQHLEQKSTNAS
jgi:hypothetical protein